MSDDELRSKAYQVCTDYIGGVWKTIQLEEIIIERLTEGFSNCVLKLSLPSNYKPLANEPIKLVMKNVMDKFNRGQFTLMTENILVVFLASKGIAPKVYGIFEGGRLDEYVESRLLKPQELHNPEVLEGVARTLARIHSLSPPISKLRNKSGRFLVERVLNESLNDSRNHNLEDSKRQLFLKLFLDINPKEELKWLYKLIDECNSPTMFCHADLLLSNILYCNDQTDCAIKLIDYEMSGYHFRGLDFGGFFRSFCLDFAYPDPPYFRVCLENFPTVNVQKKFFKIYCEEFEQRSGKKVDYEKEEKLFLEEYKPFVLLLFFAMIVLGFYSPEKFKGKMEMLDLSLNLLDAYIKQKKVFYE